MTKNEVLDKIYELLYSDLENWGFFPNKKKNKYIKKDNEFIFTILINITPNVRQHISLEVYHKTIGEIYKKVILEISGEYIKRSICSLTDWKKLYLRNNMDIGTVWFTSFNDMGEIVASKTEYLTAIKLAMEWFTKCKDLSYVYQYNLNSCNTTSIEMAFCIGKFMGNNIKEDFSIFFNEKQNYLSWDKIEVVSFVECLISTPQAPICNPCL